MTGDHYLHLVCVSSDHLALPSPLDLNASMQSPEQRSPITIDDATATPSTSQFSNAPVDLLQQFCNATTDAIVFLDRDYRFTFLNRRAWEMIWPRTDVLGSCLFESPPGAPCADQSHLENYRRCMEQGIPGSFEAFYGHPLNMWLQVRCYPSSDGIVLFFSDFTQEIAAREELRVRREAAEHQRNEIDTLYRTAPIGLALFDSRSFCCLRLNDRQAEFFGLKPDQMLGRPITEIAPIEGVRELLERVLRGEEVRDHLLEGELLTKPGRHRYWLVSCFPLFDSDETIGAISTAWLEITQQKEAEEALIQSERLGARFEERARLARDLHDTLLQTIQASKLIVDHIRDTIYESTTSGNLKQVSDWLSRALREGRAVLDFLRISTADGKDFSVALRDAFEDCRAKKNVKLEIYVSGSSREMRSSVRDDVYRIGCEAIRNACLHSQGDQINIEIFYNPDALLLTVQDNGVGIDEEMLESGRVGHYGLTGMSERALRIGADLTITGSKEGTKIALRVPGNVIYRSPRT